jgi:membrane fusion protein (multidrug efflux system)
MNISRRTATVSITTIAIVSAFALQSCKNADGQNSPQTPDVQVLTIDTTSAVTSQDYTAAIQGKTDVAIRPQVSGYLEHTYVDEGAYVTAGQPLFKIDERAYSEQLNNAVANQHAAEASITAAQLEIDKLAPLVENKVVSDIQLKTAKANYKLAVARAEQAKAAAGTARINVGYTIIKAPASGYIGRLPFKNGSLVSSSDPTPLTMLSDVKEVHAYFSMSETEFIRFTKQYSADNLPAATLVLADDEEYPVTGKVDMIDGQFDKTTGAITLRATFNNDKGILRSGNTGRVRILQQHNNTLLVPQQSTIELQDKVFVYALDDKNKISKKLISIAGKTGTDYIIKDGLTRGARIVYTGVDHLQEGMEVKPQKATEATASK